MGATNPNAGAGAAPGGGGKGGMGMNRGPGQVSPLGPAATGGLTPMHNLTAGQPQKFSMPQRNYQPSTGWVDGQPAQWAAQKAAMNPAPSPQQGILDIRNRMLYGR